MLTFDIVVVTRNRQDALPLSIPRMLGQSRRPERLVVVDSSDDHDATRRAVAEGIAAAGEAAAPVEISVRRVDPSRRGITRQRNEGLRHVASDVVFFPDDDAIWFPGVAESIMRVYERDEAGVVGGVCAAESPSPPPELRDRLAASYRMTRGDRIQQRVAHLRTRLEKRLFPDPFVVHGRSLWERRPAPTWLAEENAVLVEWMTGFRMSYRTELVRKTGFEDAFAGYGGFEDVDGSWGVGANHLLVGARNARVFHYRAPNRRSDGYGMGMRQILNKAYVVCKHTDPESPARRRLLSWCRFKVLAYALASFEPYGRERFLGAWRSLKRIPALLDCPPEALTERYVELRGECLGPRGEV